MGYCSGIHIVSKHIKKTRQKISYNCPLSSFSDPHLFHVDPEPDPAQISKQNRIRGAKQMQIHADPGPGLSRKKFCDIVESLQSHCIHTQFHWSRGPPVCFPSLGTQVQSPAGYLCKTRILLLALSHYIHDPDMIDHCGLV